MVRQRRMNIGTHQGIASSSLISSAPLGRSIQGQGEAAAAHRWPPRIPGTAATDPGGGATDSGLDAAQPYVPGGVAERRMGAGIASAPCGITRGGSLTAWMPPPRRWDSMNEATMQYERAGRAASRMSGGTGACRQRTGTRSDARDHADPAHDRLKANRIESRARSWQPCPLPA